MGTVNWLQQAVLNAGATYCKIKINRTIQDIYEEDLDSPLSMSVSLFIAGGNDRDIARAIYDSKAVGIALNGDFRVDVDGCHVCWYNLNYDDYNTQKIAQDRLSRKLEKEYLLQRLAELGETE
jgi:hypothetical protein